MIYKLPEDLVEQIKKTQAQAAKVVEPVIDAVQKIQPVLQKISNDILKTHKRFLEFQKEYNIAEEESVKVLRKYNLFITHSLPYNLIFDVIDIGSKKGNKSKEIIDLFYDFFSENNWENLDLIYKDWSQNILFKKRKKIVKDCIHVLKNSDKNTSNGINVVLPTLIAQIDGIGQDILELSGVHYDSKTRHWICKNKKYTWKDAYKKKFKHDNYPSSKLAHDVFLEVFFHQSNRGQDIPIQFNRHKIMHGENTRYGRKDYLVRALLIIDYLLVNLI